MRTAFSRDWIVTNRRLKALVSICIGMLLIAVVARSLDRRPSNTKPIVPSIGTVTNQPNSAATTVTVSDRQVLVNGAPFTIRGVGYAPAPIGDDPETTPPYGDYFTSGYNAIYSRDLPTLRRMGANTIRLWGWKHDTDHSDFLDAAYNDGVRPIHVIVSYWLDASRDISDPTVRQTIRAEFVQMVAIHKNHPAVLMWAIGNELNAPWMFGDSEDLFSLIDEMAQAAHAEEGSSYHPVTSPLADVNLINTITNRDPEVPNLDVWSVQVYRGSSFGSLFSEYAKASAKPLVITEYGIDAYDDENADEYENIGTPYQATYAKSLWIEIVANSDVCSGGAIMAYSDEWWKGKYGQTDSTHPDCPDSEPSLHGACGYANGAHPDEYANEEWWGVVRPIDNGANPDTIQPRAVYYTLQSLWLNQVHLPFVSKESKDGP